MLNVLAVLVAAVGAAVLWSALLEDQRRRTERAYRARDREDDREE